MASETASKPAGPRSKGGAANGARALDSAASAVREKLRVRERQMAMLVGQVAAQLEDKQPGRIFAVRLTCTRYKTTGSIVFNQRRARAPMNERDAGDDSDDDDSDDEDAAGTGLVSGPPASKVAASKPAAAAKAAATGAADAAKLRGGREAAAGSPGGWQQPKRPAKQQPPQQPKQQKADRNAISARGPGQMQPGQLAAIANSVSATSKEVCPGSMFTVRRDVPIDGAQVAMHLVPTSTAATLQRQHPNLLGERLKLCFLAGDSSALRELLAPGDPMSIEAQQRPRTDTEEDMGFDLFDKQ